MATIFTRIVNGEIPAFKVAEDENYLAFLDISPIVRGHILVIPKKEEEEDLFDLDDAMFVGLHLFAKKVAVGLKKAVSCKKVGVLVMGLEVPHAHIHLIPIQKEADMLNFSNKLKFTKEELEVIREKISKNISL